MGRFHTLLVSSLLLGCAARGTVDAATASARETQPSDAVLLVGIECSPAALRENDGADAEWTAVVFDRWSGFHWVVSAKETHGTATIRKFYDPRPKHESMTFSGTWTWNPDTGALRVESTQARGGVVKWWAKADIEPGSRAALGQMGETIGPPAYAEPTEFTERVLIVVQQGSTLLKELESLYFCAADALREYD